MFNQFSVNVKKAFTNKVVIYILTRYMTYFIQFLTSVLIAVKLGPYYFGIWGFVLLLINYLQLINLGISNSLNILMVQHRADDKKVKDYVATSIIIVMILGFIISLFLIYYKLFGIQLLEKYEIGNLIYFIIIIAIFFHLNNVFLTIYRVKNNLKAVAFYQTIIPLLVFIAIFFARDRILLIILLGSYIFGHSLSLWIFIKGGLIPRGGKPQVTVAKEIISKGLYLFYYNLSFYLIIVSTRTIISIFYSLEEFGFFTFSFSLAHAIVLFLDAIVFIIFPKLIDKFNSRETNEIKNTLGLIKTNYVVLSHGIVYLSLIAFPVFLYFIPQYSNTLMTLNFIALTVVLGTNYLGYSSFLMAKNQDKTLAIIALTSLIVNIAVTLGLVMLIKVSYTYAMFGTIVSYMLFSYLCTHNTKKILDGTTGFFEVFKEFFPANLLIPYLVALSIMSVEYRNLTFLPFIVFILLNVNQLKEITLMFKKVILRPGIADL